MIGAPGPALGEFVRQHEAYAAIAVAALLLTAAGRLLQKPPFETFVGHAEPLLASVPLTILGAALLAVLTTRGEFTDWAGNLRGPALALGLATATAIVIVSADLVVRYPEDMNVAFPESAVFYPVIGLMVEILFHLLPLALILGIGFPALEIALTERRVWLVLVGVATLEPSFQAWVTLSGRTIVSTSAGEPLRVTLFTWAHMFVINLAQLALFRRFDFASMYTLRLSYYLWWHVIWGSIRLRVLF